MLNLKNKFLEKAVNNNNHTYNKVAKSYVNSFTMYSETDLDQPTNYSLRYSDDSFPEQHNKIAKREVTEFVQDTVKTYYTEDTPNQTPIIFSTSTSMSDLRIDDKSNNDSKRTEETVIHKEISRDDNEGEIKLSFSSGIMSPEKPVNYCDEGTPRYFSRISSCCSLNLIATNDSSKPKEENITVNEDESKSKRINKFSPEGKVVKFEEVVNYAEETPLMFSRSSSLTSLDSIEQHSIHDDKSSVVSDFSRITSGLISPSELPDSPSQTMPPSPKPSIVFSQASKNKIDDTLEQSPSENMKCSMFEDSVKNFKVESTPLQYSRTTSLSSLTIDDQDESKVSHNQLNLSQETASVSQNQISTNNNLDTNDIEKSENEAIGISIEVNGSKEVDEEVEEKPSALATNETGTDGRLSEPGSTHENNDFNDSVFASDSDEENEEALLRECISSGMPKSNGLPQSTLLKDSVVNQSPKSNKSDKTDIIQKVNDEVIPQQNVTLETQKSKTSLTELTETEQALLTQCILAGIYKKTLTPNQQSESNSHVLFTIEDNSSEDEDLLADCINVGMTNNRYSQQKNNPIITKTNYTVPHFPPGRSDPVNDTIKSYCTEDTPAILSHAGSHSDLSILSEADKDFLSGSSDDDELLLAECVKVGMARTTNANNSGLNLTSKSPINNLVSPINNLTGSATRTTGSNNPISHPAPKISVNNLANSATRTTRLNNSILNFTPKSSANNSVNPVPEPVVKQKVNLSFLLENKSNENNHRNSPHSPVSGDSCDQSALLECIRLGMPKAKKSPKPAVSTRKETADLTEADQALLHQCILEGMRNCRISPKKPPENRLSEINGPDRRNVLFGVQKNKNSNQKPSKSRYYIELTEPERALLEQCILTGMPKSRTSNTPAINPKYNSVSNPVPTFTNKLTSNNRQWLTESRDNDRSNESVEHKCCIHCPRNNVNRVTSQMRMRKRSKFRNQVVDGREVNFLYVTSQILAMKKELIDRSHEEWI